MKNKIPNITDPMGKSWKQPNNNDILIDDKNAILTEAQIYDLHTYSTSLPTGVYVGKMWKRIDADGMWLVWYGEGKNKDSCSINYRLVLEA